MIYKFNDTNYNIENSVYYDIYQYFKDGGNYEGSKELLKYTCTWDNGDKAHFNRMDYELISNGYKKVMGWIIDFRYVWNKYLVNYKYYGWVELYAPNKTAIRDVLGNHNILDKIIEL